MGNKVAILGDGQLARMMIQAWNKLLTNKKNDLDPTNAPIIIGRDRDRSCAAQLCANDDKVGPKYHKADITDKDDLGRALASIDPANVGLEVEAIHPEPLKALGDKVMPSGETLEMIQDKAVQRAWMVVNDIPILGMLKFFDSVDDLKKEIDKGEAIDFPIVIKSRTGGYDGAGVAFINSADELETKASNIKGKISIEPKLESPKEYSVIVVSDGVYTKTYPTVEMFYDKDNQLESLVTPPRDLERDKDEEAQGIAKKIAAKLDLKGILAVEFLQDDEGKLYVNEMAPRTHNSGHHTIDVSNTSQFENYMRVLYGLPLGDTGLKEDVKAAAIYNITGNADFVEGEAKTDTLVDFSKPDHDPKKVFFHNYGKTYSTKKPNRKLGHLTTIGDNPEAALKLARDLGKLIKLEPKKK